MILYVISYFHRKKKKKKIAKIYLGKYFDKNGLYISINSHRPYLSTAIDLILYYVYIH